MKRFGSLIALTATLLMLGACGKLDERQQRFDTLLAASSAQIRSLGGPTNSPDAEHSLRARAISTQFWPEELRRPKAPEWMMVKNTVILDPQRQATTDAAPEEQKPLETVIEELQAFRLVIQRERLLSGATRLTVQRPVYQPAPLLFRQKLLVRRSTLSPCDNVRIGLTASNVDEATFLSCLIAYFEQAAPQYSVSPDYMLSPAQSDAQAVKAPAASRFWAHTPYEMNNPDAAVIALVDTGMGLDTKQMGGFDFVSDPLAAGDGDGIDANPQDVGDLCDPNNALQKDSLHGPALAGLISQAPNRSGALRAILMGAKLMPVRVSGRCGARLSDALNGLAWSSGMAPVLLPEETSFRNETPADLILFAFSAPGQCPPALQSLVRKLHAEGRTMIVPAGNHGAPASGFFPANCEDVIAVAASDRAGHLTAYSNYGPEIDVIAPGGDLAADLDEDGWPDGIIVPAKASNCRDPISGASVEKCRLALAEGTSLAALRVTAELTKQLDQPASNESVSEIIRRIGASVEKTQCRGPCPETRNGTPIEGMPGQCHRPCGTRQITASSPLTSSSAFMGVR